MNCSTADQACIERAISDTQPEQEGQRHRKLFDLCRSLKAIPSVVKAKRSTLRPIVKEWHRRALATIRTKEFSATWADFLDAWKRVKYPAGHGRIDRAFKNAMKRKPPRRAARLYPDEPKMILLAALCRVLQHRAGDKDFFLDCRTVGRLFDVSHKTAWKMLRVLCADRILKLRKSGSLARHLANQYRCVARKRHASSRVK
jgi:hypothetical protein